MIQEITDKEAFEASYETYLFALRALASEPAAACAAYGHYNVARELRDDVSAGKYLVSSPACTFAPSQVALIMELATALATLPSEVVLPVEDAEESLRLMRHPAWDPVRALARVLIGALPTAGPLH